MDSLFRTQFFSLRFPQRPHGVDDKLDMRVAYSEGLANAISGIITQDSIYRDSDSFWPYFGWSMNMESITPITPGGSMRARFKVLFMIYMTLVLMAWIIWLLVLVQF